ncbi:MAG: hypothetical protein AB7V13_20990 [Pseudorhodoplanes sp.]
MRKSTFLAGLVICSTIFSSAVLGQDPNSFATPNGLTAADVRLLNQAALNAGVDPGIVVRFAALESNTQNRGGRLFDANARPAPFYNGKGKLVIPTAYGYGQFTNTTWLETVRKYGSQYGINGSANLTMADVNKPEIRDNRAIQAAMLAEFTRANVETARRLGGGSDDDANTYVMHNLGAGDGPKFLGALAGNPDAPISKVLTNPSIIKGNSSLYGDGSVTVAEAYKRMGAKLAAYSNNTVPAMIAPDPGTNKGPPSSIIAPDLIAIPREAAAEPLPGGISLSRAAADAIVLDLDLDGAFVSDGRIVLSGSAAHGMKVNASLFMTALRLACEDGNPYFSLDPDDGNLWTNEGRSASDELFERIKSDLKLVGPAWWKNVPDGLRFRSFSAKRDYPQFWSVISSRYPNLKTRLVFKPLWLAETRFGEIMYVADVLLKELSSGVQTVQAADKQLRALKVNSYIAARTRTAAERLIRNVDGDPSGGLTFSGHRFWFDLVPRAKSQMRSMLDEDPVLPKFYSPTSRNALRLNAELTRNGVIAASKHYDPVRDLSIEGNAVDLSNVYPTMFVIGHNTATNKDMMEQNNPYEQAVADDVNRRMPQYIAAYSELRNLTEAFRLYVAAVAVVKRSPSSGAVCSTLKNLPLLPSEKVSRPLPEFRGSDVDFTVASYRSKAAKNGGTTSWWSVSGATSGGVTLSVGELISKEHGSPITRAVLRENEKTTVFRRMWESKTGRKYVALLLHAPIKVATNPGTSGASPAGKGLLDDVDSINQPSSTKGLLDDVDSNHAGIVKLP